MTTYRTTSARAVIKYKDQILVEWFAPKNIAFLPGGTVESGEELSSALRRELAEELEGSGFSILRYCGEIGHQWKTSSGTDSCLNHFFEVEASEPEKIRAKELGREIRWIPIHSNEMDSVQPPSLQRLLRTGIYDNCPWKFED